MRRRNNGVEKAKATNKEKKRLANIENMEKIYPFFVIEMY